MAGKNRRVVKIKTTNWDLLKFLIFFVMLLPFAGLVGAETADLDTAITAEDKAKFDEVLTPVVKIYNFIKYTASVIAVIALLGAGISYMFSGNDVRKRDVSKNMFAYVIIGLVIIWAAPFAVNLLIA
ncbi:TrbC/VirB2 family protein [Candidatus Woesearchaeota archaeon]|nr:TrbC/VirB2 family protein [Candidatus Woesearchaeota archaeon]